jgi:hypothetical protein
MSALMEKRNAAGDAYLLAVTEFLKARRDLEALDRLCERQGFGVHPDMVSLRHSTFAPALSGAVTDGVQAAIAAHSA